MDSQITFPPSDLSSLTAPKLCKAVAYTCLSILGFTGVLNNSKKSANQYLGWGLNYVAIISTETTANYNQKLQPIFIQQIFIEWVKALESHTRILVWETGIK